MVESKSTWLILELIDKNFYPLLKNKPVAKMCIILEICFQHISIMSIVDIFSDVWNIKL